MTRDEELEEEAILHLPVLEEVAKQWFRAVADGNEAKVAERLAADPAVTELLSCVETAHGQGPGSSSSYDAPGCCSTALLLAAGQGHDKIVELLLAAKSSVDATDFDGRSALHYAAAKSTISDKPSDENKNTSGPSFSRVVTLLLAACPTLIDAVDGEGCTALLCAVKQKNEAIVNQLLLFLVAANHNNPKSLDAEDSSGLNVLHYAIQQENEALVWRLLAMKPELIHRVAANGFTPLHMSIQWSAHSLSPLNHMAHKLYRLCPQVATDYDQAFLLRVAVRDDCESDLDLYLPISTFDQVMTAFRAMNNKKSFEGRLRPLIDVQCGPLSMVLNQDVMGIVHEYLFFTQQQRNELEGEKADEGELQKTLWFQAVRRGDKELVTQMLSEDPSLLEVREGDGNTGALHLAAIGGHSSIVELLLAARPTLGLLGNKYGKTALMFAARGGQDRVTEMLIAACPESLELVDRGHCTALLLASSHGQETVSTILAANPKNFKATDVRGYNVLHHAIRVECVERMETLLELDPSLACNLNSRLQTPLWYAVEQGANTLIKRLFDMFPQALHMAAAEGGLTPYDLAARNKNDFAVNFFMPKLTFEENVRTFRKFHAKIPIFDWYGTRLRSVIDVQCEDVAKVLNQTLMSTIYSYLGFGALCVLNDTGAKTW